MIHLRASGMATVSASRLCISTTSMPRSRILLMKSKWSRLATSTHSTSSKSKASQLLGVSRWWARPGAHTSTLRNWPTSECTPKLVPMVNLPVLSPSGCDLAGCKAEDANEGRDDDRDEDAELDRGEVARTLLTPGPEIEDAARRKEHGHQQDVFEAGGNEHEQRVD